MSSDGKQPESPAELYETDGGIYLGLTTEGRTDQRRPLYGKENDPTTPRGMRFRSTWEPDGEAHFYTGEGHIGIWGPQGSGKSRKILVPNLMRLRNWSKVVIDIKGELTATTALYLMSRGHQVHVCDPFGVIEREYPRLFAFDPKLFSSARYNHVAALDPLQPYFVDEAKALAMALNPKEEGAGAYWSNAGQALTKGALMALRVDKPGSSDTFEVLRHVVGMRPEDLAKFMDLMIRTHGSKYPAISASLAEFASYRPEDREIGGIRRNVRVNTDWLDSPLIQADCRGANVIDFASFKHRPQTCFIILPPGQLLNQGVWLRAMINAALQPLLRSVRVAPVPVLFMIDEIAALGNMEFLAQNIGLLRGFGVKLMMVWQSVHQMKTIYPRSWETFMNAAEAKVTFTSNDIDTLDYFSRLSGERLYRHTFRSTSLSSSSTFGASFNDGSNHGQGGFGWSHGAGSSESFNTSQSASTNEGLQNERTAKTYEIAALDADEAIIFSRRGRIDRTLLPQPGVLPGVDRALSIVRPFLIDDGREASPVQMIGPGPGLDRVSGRRPDPARPPAE